MQTKLNQMHDMLIEWCGIQTHTDTDRDTHAHIYSPQQIQEHKISTKILCILSTGSQKCVKKWENLMGQCHVSASLNLLCSERKEKCFPEINSKVKIIVNFSIPPLRKCYFFQVLLWWVIVILLICYYYYTLLLIIIYII